MIMIKLLYDSVSDVCSLEEESLSLPVLYDINSRTGHQCEAELQKESGWPDGSIML